MHISKVVEALDDRRSALNNLKQGKSETPKEQLWINFYFDHILPALISIPGTDGQLPTEDEKEERISLWVTLIFRMLCWFLLHDFDPEDVKIVPSNLRGSRILVYIG